MTPFDGYEEYLKLAAKVAPDEAVLLVHPHVRAAVLFCLRRLDDQDELIATLKADVAALKRHNTRYDSE